MTIFFTASVRGGRTHQPKYASIVSILEKYGTVSSPHIGDDALSEHGETHLSESEILEREQSALKKSDLIVAEVTTPSLGVGYLIALGVSLGKKVVALYCGEDTLKLSAIIKGDSRIDVYRYKNEADIEGIVRKVLENSDSHTKQ